MTAYKVDYAAIKPQAETALREAFPESFVEVTEGYEGRAHIVIVSPVFNGLSLEARQQLVYQALERRMGPEARYVTLVITWGTEELR